MIRRPYRLFDSLALRASLVLVMAFAFCASVATAQAVGSAFQGTFTATVPSGEAIVTLSVAERVTGTLIGPGTAIDLVGDLDVIAGAVRGVATASTGSAGFEATLRGDVLTLTLFEVDAGGRPLAGTAVALELQRAPARRGGVAGRGTPRGASPPSEEQPAPVGAVTALTPDLVRAVHEAVEETLTLPESLLELAIDAALEAGRLGQAGMALAGTLSQSSDGALRFARDTSDALRIELLDGSTFTIVFHGAPQGHLGEGGSAFVEAPHILDITVRGRAEDRPIDLRVTSTPLAQDGTQDVRLSGRFGLGDATWEVEARLERFERFVFDGVPDGELRIRADMTLSSADLGARVTSSRTFRYRLVNLVENIDHEIDTEIVLVGDRVRLNGRAFVALREALPVDRDQWVVRGGLTRDGTTLGTIRAAEGPTALRVILELEGTSLPLYTFPY